MDRRETIKWVLAASAVMSMRLESSESSARPYGTDPDLQRVYHPGELWPLTLNPTQRKQAAALCDTVIPADASSPSASQVGVVDFIDEWISAPYTAQRQDREVVLQGLQWLDAESQRRFSRPLVEMSPQQWHDVCADICWVPKAKPEFLEAARFFALYRDLTTGGFYTTPQGRSDLRYVGNTPLPRFDGPPLEVLKKVGLA